MNPYDDLQQSLERRLNDETPSDLPRQRDAIAADMNELVDSVSGVMRRLEAMRDLVERCLTEEAKRRKAVGTPAA